MGGEFSESGEPSNTWAPVIYIYFQSDRKISVACFSFSKPLSSSCKLAKIAVNPKRGKDTCAVIVVNSESTKSS